MRAHRVSTEQPGTDRTSPHAFDSLSRERSKQSFTGVKSRTISRWLRIIAGVMLLAALVVVFDINAIGETLAATRLGWLGLAAALIAASTLLGAWNLFFLLNRSALIRFRSFLHVYWVGWALNLVIPGQVGDMAGISALLRSYGIPLHVSVGCSLVDKMLSVMAIASMGMLGIWLHFRTSILGSISGDLSLTVTFTAVVAVAGALLILKLLRRHCERMRTFARHVVRDIWLTASLHPRRIVTNLALSVIKMALTGLAYWCAFRAMGYHNTDPVAVTLLAAASSLVAYVPVSLNGLGTVELAGVVLFGSLEIPAHAVVSAYLLLRAIVIALACGPLALGSLVPLAKSA